MDTSIKQKQLTFDYHQLLLSWFSPSFPIGSFNFSHGLEAAIEYKFVYDKITLEEWIKHLIINGAGKTDSILLANSYEGKYVNELAFALSASKESPRVAPSLYACMSLSFNFTFLPLL